MASSDTGASGAGGASGSAGPGRKFVDLSQAHTAITGRSGQGTNTPGVSEAQTSDNADGQELGPAGSTTDSLGEIFGAYAPSETVESRSVSQHTATLYKLEGHTRARLDGAANPVLAAEEEDDDDGPLPEELLVFAPRGKLPKTPPSFQRGHRQAKPLSGPSPSSVANSEGLLADTPPPVPPLPVVRSALVWAKQQRQQQQQHEDEEVAEHDVAFLGQSSASVDEAATAKQLRRAASTAFSQSPNTTPGRPQPHHQQQQHYGAVPVVFADHPLSEQASSPAFSYGSPEGQSSTDRIVYHAAPHAGTSSSSAAGGAVLPRVRRPALAMRDGVPFQFPARPTPSLPRHLQPFPSSSLRPPFGRDISPLAAALKYEGNRKYDFRDSMDEDDFANLASDRPSKHEDVAARYEEKDAARKKKKKGKEIASPYERLQRLEETQAAKDRKGKGKEIITSPYERLEDDEHNDQYFGFSPEPLSASQESTQPPPTLLTQQVPALRRPTISTLGDGSVRSHDSKFSFPLVGLEEAQRIAAERRARGEFDFDLIERVNPRSNIRDLSSSSQVPSSTPGGPLDTLIKLYKRKPVATAESSSTPQRPSHPPVPTPGSLTSYQPQRDLTYSRRPIAAVTTQEQELGPLATPSSLLESPYLQDQPPPRPQHQRIGSYEIFNSDVNPVGDLIPRQPALPSQQTAASSLALTDYSNRRTDRTHTQRLADQQQAEYQANRRAAEEIELADMPLQPRPIPPGERWDEIDLENDPVINSSRYVGSLGEVFPAPMPDRRA